MPQLMLGQLAKSVAGRDKGRFMVVIDIINENYVYVVDGDLRRVENPKKKKIKHLYLFNERIDFIAEKLKNNSEIHNEEIKKTLEKMVDENPYGHKSNRI